MRSGTFCLRYRTPSGSGKYIGFGLRIETGAERITVVDIFDIIQQVRDTGIHLKVDEEPKNSFLLFIVDSHIQRIILATEETAATWGTHLNATRRLYF